ncbi:unnamed protein product [Somion occarium]|uniref:Uncharacterized protein n=1 Tax=Somion occarium TaxID=3059160 RepID=A0ABP1DTJ0_9APHY
MTVVEDIPMADDLTIPSSLSSLILPTETDDDTHSDMSLLAHLNDIDLRDDSTSRAIEIGSLKNLSQLVSTGDVDVTPDIDLGQRSEGEMMSVNEEKRSSPLSPKACFLALFPGSSSGGKRRKAEGQGDSPTQKQRVKCTKFALPFDPDGESTKGPGTSKSATHDRELRAQWKAGTLLINQAQLERWQWDCRAFDKKVEFKPDNPVDVWCGGCGKWLSVSTPALHAKEPSFLMTICAQMFELVHQHLKSLNYDGPVALSCDDTKLSASWRLVQKSEDEGLLLIGGIGGPIRVPDPAAAQAIIDSGKVSEATKVRLFTLQVPLPGVGPILVAALPIGESNKAEDLVGYSVQVIRGLVGLGIKVASYSCDGTETERKVQQLLCELADECRVYKVPSPHGNGYELTIRVAIYGDCPIIMIQDSKHALKTFRNNLFFGAWLLVIGNATALYRRIHTMAYQDASPLYVRDVDRLDRQDDNAATRLFSSHALEHLVQENPDFLGEIIYLFIFGELVDAYQNRHIPLIEQFKLILRAYYFLCMWKTFLERAGYQQSHYFISPEATDITRMLVEGLAGLIFIYRDYYTTDSKPFPLLPWLHSSEPCEHAFGSARQVVKDFTMLNFHYMIQKLRLKTREAAMLAEAADPKGRAMSYNHTYVNSRGINVTMLATYFSDSDLPDIADVAMQEAESVIGLLGLAPDMLHAPDDAMAFLPSINSWYNDNTVSPDANLDSGTDGDNSSDDEDEDEDEDDLAAGIELRELLRSSDMGSLVTDLTRSEEDRLTSLASAAVALALDNYLTVEDLLDIDGEMEDEIFAEECELIHASIAAALPPVKGVDEWEKPFGQGTVILDELDLGRLVELRQLHKTRQAIEGVRTKSQKKTEPPEKSTQ